MVVYGLLFLGYFAEFKMNFLLDYQFHKEAQPNLQEFIRIANLNKANPHVDMNRYRICAEIFKIDSSVSSPTNNTINAPLQNGNQTQVETVLEDTVLNETTQIENTTTAYDQTIVIEDIIHTIKEKRATDLPDTLILGLSNCKKESLRTIFNDLQDKLNSDDLVNLGLTLNRQSSPTVIKCYLKCLLFNKIKNEYSSKLQELLNVFFENEEFLSEFSKILIDVTEDEARCFAKYISNLTLTNQSLLLSKFVSNCKQLNSNNLMIIDSSLHTQTEVEIWKKLFDLLSACDSDFNGNKGFGKFLLRVLEVLDKNITLFEGPIKVIIGLHSSIWKKKLQKALENCLIKNANISTQSFM